MKTAEVNLGPSSNIFKPFCTQAYSCNIDQPTGLENVNMSANETLLKGDFLKMNNTKVNKEDKEVGESFDSNETLLKKNEGDKYDLNMNVPREVGYKPQKNIVGADCRNNKSFAVDKAKRNSKQAVYNTKGIGSLEINNAKSLKHTEPISDPAYNRNIFKCTLVQRKQAINTAYEVQNLEPIYPRVSSVVLTPEIDKPLFSPKRSSNNVKTYKEGNCEDEIIVNVPDKGRNSKITVGESYLRSLIKESFLKVKEEENYSIQNNVSSDGMFLEDSSGYGSEEETCDDDVGIDGFDSDDSFGSDVCFEHSNERGEICDFSCNDYQPTYFDTSGEEIDNPIQEECEETLAKGEGISRTNFDSEVFPYLRRSYKRRSSESPCNLPVIEEETSTSVLAPLSEEEFDLDYCLVDSNGKAIQLFDHNGLPLTDRRGRPLRTAKGEPLMKCDDDGIPLVDYNDCSVFDMFGRTPNHKDFDPAMAPKMPTFNRLAACDGKPLLLYDAQDRPLTSVSGTMLVDSSGRGLIRLATKPEDE
ncbi:uncharacterized protein LOC124364157 [Homalodisca vitripennis]|uniref:uncharacterized protein LOC124364157 n=1 Tax=Homalodisca vitripennis TaxID=197043 RepID=UPI001EECB806|nr:uncharacterized protein LOC124364157 [Homalodisca vitripennis]XP_046675360.1 uncharacterized protein LOC124364157 [Homalodisca vitripennis]